MQSGTTQTMFGIFLAKSSELRGREHQCEMDAEDVPIETNGDWRWGNASNSQVHLCTASSLLERRQFDNLEPVLLQGLKNVDERFESDRFDDVAVHPQIVTLKNVFVGL